MSARVRPWALAVGAVLAAVGAWASPAAAQEPPPPPPTTCGGFSVCGNPTDPDGGTGSGPSVPVDFLLGFFPDGEGVGNEPGAVGCWGIEVVPEGQGGSYEDAAAELDRWANNGEQWGPCAQETIDPAVVAAQYWRRVVQPPPPTPLTVAPGWALPGKRAYLEIGGDNPATATAGTPIGPATFTMTPRYVVSWGDDTSTETTSQGRPYPGGPGEISHVYTDAGGVRITVRAYWRATWSLAGAGGDLPELPDPTVAPLDLDVEERQVVTR